VRTSELKHVCAQMGWESGQSSPQRSIDQVISHVTPRLKDADFWFQCYHTDRVTIGGSVGSHIAALCSKS
jgi:hypothetical protein